MFKLLTFFGPAASVGSLAGGIALSSDTRLPNTAIGQLVPNDHFIFLPRNKTNGGTVPFQMPAALAPPLLSARGVIAGRAKRSATYVPAHILAASAARILTEFPEVTAGYSADQAIAPPKGPSEGAEPPLSPPGDEDLSAGQPDTIIANKYTDALNTAKTILDQLLGQLYVLLERSPSLDIKGICCGIIALSKFLSGTTDVILLDMQIEFIRTILKKCGVKFREDPTGVDMIYAMKAMKNLIGQKTFQEIFDRLDLFERTAKQRIITPFIEAFFSVKNSGIETASLKAVLEGIIKGKDAYPNLSALIIAGKLHESQIVNLKLRELLPKTETVFPAGYRTARIVNGELKVDSTIESADSLLLRQWGITQDDRTVLFAYSSRKKEEFDIGYDEKIGGLIRNSGMIGPLNNIHSWWMAAEANRLEVRRGTILIVVGGITPRARNLFWKLHPEGTIIEPGDKLILQYVMEQKAGGEPIEIKKTYVADRIKHIDMRSITPLTGEIQFRKL